ncbi:hypothetical protein QOZ80_1AG0016050 [Eleusine coracana subsp. coracana]|nr:hypothetical protein QOZ80_1AG0016050 [Eleusine coracana subsp. coracana]
MVNDTMVTDVDNNGGSIVLGENPMITSICVEETNEEVNENDVATVKTDESNAQSTNNKGIMESSTPITRSASYRTARRKRGAFGLFRAVFMSFSGRDIITKHKTDEDATPEKNKVVGVDSKPPATASWKSIVDGMRPLRLPGQELEYYPPPPPPLAGHVDVYQDVLLAPPSPMLSGSERGMTSRYASAQDLHLLDCGDDEEEGGAVVCPHAIDMQAEEFIAKFYEQFRLQKSELSFDGRATEDEPIDQLACM